jgi:uncharacterized membrane protein YwzB
MILNAIKFKTFFKRCYVFVTFVCNQTLKLALGYLDSEVAAKFLASSRKTFAKVCICWPLGLVGSV